MAPKPKGRTATILQMRNKQRRMLDKIKVHLRSTSEPSTNMTLIVEELVEKEFKRLKL